MSDIRIIKIDETNILSQKVKILNSFTFHQDLNRMTRERGLLQEVIKSTQKSKTKLYIVEHKGIYVGLIALSVASIADIPVAQIDYLFVDFDYRKQVISTINMTISEYLIKFATKLVEEIKQNIGIKYLVLYPDGQSEKLITFYQGLGFEQLNKEWLFIKLK